VAAIVSGVLAGVSQMAFEYALLTFVLLLVAALPAIIMVWLLTRNDHR